MQSYTLVGNRTVTSDWWVIGFLQALWGHSDFVFQRGVFIILPTFIVIVALPTESPQVEAQNRQNREKISCPRKSNAVEPVLSNIVTLRYQTPELLYCCWWLLISFYPFQSGLLFIFVFGLRNLHSSSSLMEGDKREDVEAKHREFTEDEMNGKVAQSETSTSSVLDLAFEQSSRQPFTALSQEDSDLALARALQEQERAYMMLRRNAESSDYETSGSGNYDHEYYIDDSGENEDEVDANADDFEREALADGDHEEVDASLFDSDEAYARALQEAEDRLLTAQMMALAGINDREEDDNEDNDSTSRDAWQDVDPDNMLYEELVALSEVVGTQSRGLAPDLISSLPLSKYVPESPSSSNSERCVICHLEYEGGDMILTLPCKHQYHSDCIKKWLQINKVCPVCSVEVSDKTNH